MARPRSLQSIRLLQNVQTLALPKGGGPSSFAPYPAPSGYRWEFVYEGTDQVFEGADPVIELVVIS